MPPGPKTFKSLGVAGGTIERSYYFPHYEFTERIYRKHCLRTAKQQAGAGPVTAVAIGSESAAIVG